MSQPMVELVSQLEQAVWVLGLLTTVFVVGCLAVLGALGWLLWQRRAGDGPRFDVEKADLLFQRGEFPQLLSFSEGHVSQFPYSVEALWYLGLAQYNQGDYQQALSAFDRVQRINPAWREDVSAYLSEIEQQVDEARDHSGFLLN